MRYLSNDPLRSKLYWKWSNIIQRCTNKNNPRYPVYGGRGIKVCKSWMKFANFCNDMLSTYQIGLTIDRIDTNKDYTKENCRWATQKMQQNNRSNNRILEYKGVKNTLSGWAETVGIKQSTLWVRLDNNWSLERALQQGVINHGK